jgi:hypothetical protein
MQLYKGSIKIFSNRKTFLEGSLALMADKVKEHVAGLEPDHVCAVWELGIAQSHPQHYCLLSARPQDGGGHQPVLGHALSGHM